MALDKRRTLTHPSGMAVSSQKASAKTKSDKPRKRQGAERLGREAWINAARAALVRGGVAAVKVDPMAGELGVTTGSFYWHFKDRQALLDALLKDWEESNTAPMFAVVESAGENPEDQFMALVEAWIKESDFDPAYDAAVRDWARVSAKAEAAVHRTDNRRIELLHDIFKRMGDPEPEALVRARIVYFHQVGYYALKFRESQEARMALFPYYTELLLGRPRRRGPGK